MPTSRRQIHYPARCGAAARAASRQDEAAAPDVALIVQHGVSAGHDPADVADHRARAPWYASKAQPATADMAAKLRRVIIAARFKAPLARHPVRG